MPIHASLEAVRSLREERDFDIHEISRVCIALSEGAFKAVGFPYTPTTVASAQLSLQYCVAVVLLEGDAFVDQFAENKLNAPEVLSLAAKIEIRHDPKLDHTGGGSFPSETDVEISLRSGHILSKKRSDAKQGEFAGYIPRGGGQVSKGPRGRLRPEGQERIVEVCRGLDQVEEVSELSRTLASETVSKQPALDRRMDVSAVHTCDSPWDWRLRL